MKKLIEELENRLEISETNGGELLNDLSAVKNQLKVSANEKNGSNETSVDLKKLKRLQRSSKRMKTTIESLENELTEVKEISLAQSEKIKNLTADLAEYEQIDGDDDE